MSQNGRTIIDGFDINRPYGEFNGNQNTFSGPSFSAERIDQIFVWCVVRAYQMGANPNNDVKIELEAGLTSSDFCPSDQRQDYDRVLSAYDFQSILRTYGYI